MNIFKKNSEKVVSDDDDDDDDNDDQEAVDTFSTSSIDHKASGSSSHLSSSSSMLSIKDACRQTKLELKLKYSPETEELVFIILNVTDLLMEAYGGPEKIKFKTKLSFVEKKMKGKTNYETEYQKLDAFLPPPFRFYNVRSEQLHLLVLEIQVKGLKKKKLSTTKCLLGCVYIQMKEVFPILSEDTQDVIIIRNLISV